MRVHQLRRAWGDQHHADDGREDRDPRVQRRVSEHVLQELLADEHRAHEGAEHDDPRARGHPEDAASGYIEVVERCARPTLADYEGRRSCDRDSGQPQSQGSLVRHGREVDRQHERGHQQNRQDAPEVVNGIGGLVDVRGNEAKGQVQSHQGERQTDHEHRTPVELREQGACQQGSQRGDRATQAGPQGNRLRACRSRPQRRDQRQRRGVGHPGGQPAEQARAEQNLDRRGEGGQQRGRHRQGRAEDQHQLSPVAVAQRAEIEHRRGEPERVADRDEIDRRLTSIERLADVRQRHIGDRQVQVRDRGDKDEGDEDETRPLRRGRARVGRRRRAFPSHANTFTARAITRPTIANEMSDCTVIAILAQAAVGIASVGLRAVAFVKARYR